MKQIKLYRTFIYALVDDNDFDFLDKFRWHLDKRHNKCYAQAYISGKPVRMHTLILPLTGEFDIDRKDGNGLNCQRENLRASNDSQNQANRRKFADTSSKYKGVTFHKNRQKWWASIKHNGKYIWLGTFNSERAAAKAYNEAALKHFGEFAKINEFGEPL